MRIEHASPIKEGKKFNPVRVTFTFETKEELVAFYMIFNHSVILSARGVKGVIIGSDIRTILNHCNKKENYSDIDYTEQWNDFNSSLIEYLKGR